MRRLITIAVAVGLVVILVATGLSVAFWLWGQAVAEPVLPPLPATPAVADPDIIQGRGTVVEIMRNSQTAVECQLLGPGDSPYEEGSLFISGNQARADMILAGTSTSEVHSLVVSGDVVVAWQQLGSETAFLPTTDLHITPFTYTCRSWEVDMSVFASPVVE